MADFNTSLLREKFTITDPRPRTAEAREPVIALSNRLTVDLVSRDKKYSENFVVRAQNMHSAVRMVARIIQTFQQTGPLMNRNTPFDWEAAWDHIVNNYEYAFNHNRWVAIYHKGKLVYACGEHHALLDVIENCEMQNEGIYDDSVKLAEEIFKKAGKEVKIAYDGNVALVVDVDGEQGRFGIILRGADRTTTFNFTAKATEKEPRLNVPQCLTVAAAFLEGIQLAYTVGTNNEKIRLGIIKRHSEEEKQTLEGRRRLGRLVAEVSNLEEKFEVRYRPERPELGHIVMDAEQRARGYLKPPKDAEKEFVE